MKEMQYDLTIIIPHYNMPGDLIRLLDSIGRHDTVQIIVIDDRSDAFLKELEACKEKYDYALFLQTEEGKKGAGAARNTGLDLAAGKWLLFADSDDVFLPGWYEIVSAYMKTKYDLICFAPTSIRRDGSASKRHLPYEKLVKNYLTSSYGGEERLRGHFTVPWSKLIRTSLVQQHQIRFDEVFYSADVMFSAKVGYYAETITAVDTPFYCIIDHDDSMSRTKSSDMYFQRLQIYCERDNFYKNRFSKRKFEAYGRLSFLYSVKDTLQKGYGLKAIIGMGRIYRDNGIPFIVINCRKHMYGIASLFFCRQHSQKQRPASDEKE